MIFVTVGTHEQPFNRLIKSIDELKKNRVIQEEVVIQIGFSTYIPKYCEWNKLFPYQQMIQKIHDARIVITHGGPSSFIMPLQESKIPIVVPRKREFGEHVNDHQVDFCKVLAEIQKNIIPVYDMEDLENIIVGYDEIIQQMPRELRSNNQKFNEELSKIVDEWQ